jgi:hypothetical protein
MPLILYSCCPKPVHITGFLMHKHRRLLTVKFYIISAGLRLDYLHTSLFIPIYQTAVGSISPVEFAKGASNFLYKLWENHDLTVQPVITNIYLCERAMVCNLFILIFKPSSCNGPETELKCKIGFRTCIIFAFYHIQTVGAWSLFV